MFTPEQTTIISFLQQHRPFAHIDPPEWLQLFSIFQTHHFQTDQTIIADGETSQRAFILLQGDAALYKMGRRIKDYQRGDFFGEFGLIESQQARTGTIKAITDCTLYSMAAQDLDDAQKISPALSRKLYKGFAQQMAEYLRAGSTLYRNMEVLLIQDGGCAPGYNPVTAFLSEYLEKAGYHVFVAASGFRSLMANQDQDYRCLVYRKELYRQIEHIPGVVFSPPLREARGANFRAERFPEFKQADYQQRAARNLAQRNVKIVVGIGGNGTFAGTKALSKYLGQQSQVFFVPVTIDSDLSGTECIGEYTGVEIGSEKIRCYMADARTHKRLYIIELMGAKGGYHALHSCLGAGAHLAVLPNQEHDFSKLVPALQKREGTVIVVAEGYQQKTRKEQNYGGNAAEFFRDELLAAGLQTKQKIVCEPFSRDIRGASPNNMDIMLAQRMAKKLTKLVQEGRSHLMPAVLSNHVSSIDFSDIRTDNSVESQLAKLANRLY